MAIKQQKLFVHELDVGMYVSALDKPWAETPFPIQGFVIKSTADISRIKAYCDYVYIDVDKGLSAVGENSGVTAISPAVASIRAAAARPVSSKLDVSKLQLGIQQRKTPIRTFQVKPHQYAKTVDLAKEIPSARRVMNNLIGCLSLAIRQISKGGQFSVEQLERSVGDMVDSVLRCPDAFTWLLRLRAKDSQTHDHSMRSSLWAVQFGRHIGLEKDQLQDLCLGTLLKDIGKIRVDRAVLNSRQRTADQEAAYRSFVGQSVEMLQQSGFENRRVLNIIKFHCERYDGSGFPKGISGNRIPFLATVTGIASSFDVMCNSAESGETLSPSKATGKLYELRGKAFSEELVIEFIQSIGLYPPGTIVELTTGDCGLVIEQDPKSRLAPRLAVFDRTSNVTEESSYVFVDLKDESDARQKLSSFGKKRAYDVTKLGIIRDIEPESFGIEYSLLGNLISRPFDAANGDPPASLTMEDRRSAGKGFLSALKQRFAS